MPIGWAEPVVEVATPAPGPACDPHYGTPGPRRASRQPMKSPGMAAVLSFFYTGLGQIYNGQIGKGLVMMAVQALAAGFGFWLFWGGLLFDFVARTPALSILGVCVSALSFLIWLYGIFDAHQTAERYNRRR